MNKWRMDLVSYDYKLRIQHMKEFDVKSFMESDLYLDYKRLLVQSDPEVRPPIIDLPITDIYET